MPLTMICKSRKGKLHQVLKIFTVVVELIIHVSLQTEARYALIWFSVKIDQSNFFFVSMYTSSEIFNELQFSEGYPQFLYLFVVTIDVEVGASIVCLIPSTSILNVFYMVLNNNVEAGHFFRFLCGDLHSFEKWFYVVQMI